MALQVSCEGSHFLQSGIRILERFVDAPSQGRIAGKRVMQRRQGRASLRYRRGRRGQQVMVHVCKQRLQGGEVAVEVVTDVCEGYLVELLGYARHPQLKFTG